MARAVTGFGGSSGSGGGSSRGAASDKGLTPGGGPRDAMLTSKAAQGGARLYWLPLAHPGTDCISVAATAWR